MKGYRATWAAAAAGSSVEAGKDLPLPRIVRGETKPTIQKDGLECGVPDAVLEGNLPPVVDQRPADIGEPPGAEQPTVHIGGDRGAVPDGGDVMPLAIRDRNVSIEIVKVGMVGAETQRVSAGTTLQAP